MKLDATTATTQIQSESRPRCPDKRGILFIYLLSVISVNALKDEGPNNKPYMLATSGSATCADVPPTLCVPCE